MAALDRPHGTRRQAVLAAEHDRQLLSIEDPLHRALHTIVLSRLMHDAETRAYATRRSSEGRTPREIKRCLKRHLARRLFKLLERVPMAA